MKTDASHEIKLFTGITGDIEEPLPGQVPAVRKSLQCSCDLIFCIGVQGIIAFYILWGAAIDRLDAFANRAQGRADEELAGHLDAGAEVDGIFGPAVKVVKGRVLTIDRGSHLPGRIGIVAGKGPGSGFITYFQF